MQRDDKTQNIKKMLQGDSFPPSRTQNPLFRQAVKTQVGKDVAQQADIQKIKTLLLQGDTEIKNNIEKFTSVSAKNIPLTFLFKDLANRLDELKNNSSVLQVTAYINFLVLFFEKLGKLVDEFTPSKDYTEIVKQDFKDLDQKLIGEHFFSKLTKTLNQAAGVGLKRQDSGFLDKLAGDIAGGDPRARSESGVYAPSLTKSTV